MIQLTFPDKCVTYSTFINDLATALVPKLMEAMENPSDLISQNKAFKISSRHRLHIALSLFPCWYKGAD